MTIRTPSVTSAIESSSTTAATTNRMSPALEKRRIISDPTSYQHFLCGAGSSLINIAVTFPINKLMFRQQLYGVRTHTALRQLLREGTVNLFRGLMPPLIQKSTNLAIMFGVFNKCHHTIIHNGNISPNQAIFISGMLAGTCEAALTPFERVQVLLLTPKYQNTFRNSFHAFKTIGTDYGVKEYFRGVSAILYRNGPSTTVFFALRLPIKDALPHAEKNSFQNSLNDFISGAMIGAICSTLFYPVNVVKSRMQSQLGGEFRSFSATFRTIYHERNHSVRKLFRGMHVNLARSLISWGIINAAYEKLMETFFR